MNKLILSLFLIITTSVYAKKVKFAVDMTGQTISPFGIHIAGDFQMLAGYPADWDYSSTLLSQEGTTDIYSIVVDIPAFRKYEFKFINGDQGYEAEFVPDEIRVGYDFNDNRWMYVDSLTNDTSFIGAVQFGLSSPAGKYAIRYKVDMTNSSASVNGIRVSTNYNAFSYNKNTMYTFSTNPTVNIYEVINYVDAGTYEYNFVNGNSSSDKESNVPNDCSNLGVRSLVVSKDTVFPEICYNACVSCLLAGIKENKHNNQNLFSVYPNPATNNITITSNNDELESLELYNITGQLALKQTSINSKSYTIPNLNVIAGIYTLKTTSNKNNHQYIKLIIE